MNSDFYSEDGDDDIKGGYVPTSKAASTIVSAYRFYLRHVHQGNRSSHDMCTYFYELISHADKLYTAHVAGLSPLASKRETALWLALYPFRREKPILKYMWVALATFIVCLLIHGWSTRVVRLSFRNNTYILNIVQAYYFHTSGTRLRDLGFLLLPELPSEYRVLSEIIFNFIFIGT